MIKQSAVLSMKAQECYSGYASVVIVPPLINNVVMFIPKRIRKYDL